MSMNMGKIITVTSVKGGTGKTTTLLNLAGIYSKMNKKVLIMDFDLYTGAVAATLNLDITTDIYKLVDDLMNNRFDYIENYVLKYNDNIDVIAAPKDPRYASKISSKYLKAILTRVSMKYDVVLIDTNHALDEKNLTVLDCSDNIVYVINNNAIDLKNMKTIVSIFKDANKDNYKIVLNESNDKSRNYFNKHNIKNIIKDNINFIIPSNFYIKNIDKYVLDGEILTLNKYIISHYKKVIDNFEVMAKNLLKENNK